jgi:hypothetical protein
VKLFRTLLFVACCGVALYPIVARQVAKRRAAERLARLERAPMSVCDALDDAALSLRVQRLGPLLASWETIGGCGAGGATGTGVKWIGRNTTGGLFQAIFMNNFVFIPVSLKPGQGAGGYNEIANLQLGKDFIFDPWNGSWNLSLSVPYLYKHYNDFLGNGPLSNGGIGDVNLFLSRKLGTDNSTTVTVIAGIPTGTYTAQYKGTYLTPDEQLGFGRLTGTLQVEHTFDQDWGLAVVGGTAGYRGGKQTDKFLWVVDKPSQHNYRAPSASIYGYAGYFLGPLVPALGLNLTGYTEQDTRGDFGETLDAPVATGALHASIEWSNPYVAILGGVFVPIALRGTDWHTSATANGDRYLQPWTVAVGISTSPF